MARAPSGSVLPLYLLARAGNEGKRRPQYVVERAEGWITCLRLQVRKGKFVPSGSTGPSASQNLLGEGGQMGSDQAVGMLASMWTGSNHFWGH